MPFGPCSQCQGDQVSVRTGYAAVPPDDNTVVTEHGDGWKSANLEVVPTLVMWCLSCGWTVAGHGGDADRNPVPPLAGVEIFHFLTDPDLVVLDDDQVRRLLSD